MTAFGRWEVFGGRKTVGIGESGVALIRLATAFQDATAPIVGQTHFTDLPEFVSALKRALANWP